MDLLSPDEAAPIVGAPVAQLLRWAWLEVGPKNSGTRWKPKYDEDDLRGWVNVSRQNKQSN
jgi:hypothetical protein